MAQEHEDEKFGHAKIEGEFRPKIKQGTYDLVFQHYETAKLFNGRALKLILWFSVNTQGEYFGVKLPRFYNVKRIKGRTGKNGDFVLSPNCDFVREYAALFPLPSRLDRIPMSVFKNKIFIGGVRTVTNGFKQAKIPESLQYSVIGDLNEIKKL